MARELLSIACDGAALAASLDRADGATGLLIVAGGSEIRSGAHGGLARLAAAVADAGFPTLRFDRRGTGDSGGRDPGFREAGPDINAAAEALRRLCPQVTTLVGFGLCDGATALALLHEAARLDGLILANPWVAEPAAEGLPPAAAIRRRYAQRLREPAAWARLLTGRLDLASAARGLGAAAARSRPPPLAGQLRDRLGRVPATALLAEQDATAIAFAAEHRRRPFPGLRLETLATASHSFADRQSAAWLRLKVIDALAAVRDRPVVTP